MSNPGYINSVDGDNADDGSTWALANADAPNAMSDQASGDRIWFSDNHAETAAANKVITVPGTLANNCELLCGDDAAEPPTALATTATISTTGAFYIRLIGSFFCHGITFNVGSGANSVDFQANYSGVHYQIYDSCNINIVATGSTANFTIGSATSAAMGGAHLKNTDVSFASVNGNITVTNGRFHWDGGTLNTSNATSLLKGSSGRSNDILVENVDLSIMTSGSLVDVGAMSVGATVVRNCEVASGVGYVTGTFDNVGVRVVIDQCSSGDPDTDIIKFYEANYAGEIREETTIVRTGGSNNGIGTYSMEMDTTGYTTADNTAYPFVELEGRAMHLKNTTKGSSVNIDIEIVHDSQGSGAGSDMQNDEIRLEVIAYNSAGLPIGTMTSNGLSDILATPTDHANSSETWTTTGLTTPVKQYLRCTFTPQEECILIGKVILTKANVIVYSDLVMTAS